MMLRLLSHLPSRASSIWAKISCAEQNEGIGIEGDDDHEEEEDGQGNDDDVVVVFGNGNLMQVRRLLADDVERRRVDADNVVVGPVDETDDDNS